MFEERHKGILSKSYFRWADAMSRNDEFDVEKAQENIKKAKQLSDGNQKPINELHTKLMGMGKKKE